MIKYLTYTCLLFSGKDHSYFRQERTKRGLTDLVQIHHIIPRELSNHPTIIFSDYDIEDGYNLIFLPTNKGSETLNLHKDRPLHYRGHNKYNRYVRMTLDIMFSEDRTSRDDLCKFNNYLRDNMRHCKVEWN